jgi:hypothetical protein
MRLEKKTTANRVVGCLLPGWTVIPQTEARWTVFPSSWSIAPCMDRGDASTFNDLEIMLREARIGLVKVAGWTQRITLPCHHFFVPAALPPPGRQLSSAFYKR